MRLDTRGSISKIEILYRHLRAFDTFKSPAFKKKLSFSSSSFSDGKNHFPFELTRFLFQNLIQFLFQPEV